MYSDWNSVSRLSVFCLICSIFTEGRQILINNHWGRSEKLEQCMDLPEFRFWNEFTLVSMKTFTRHLGPRLTNIVRERPRFPHCWSPAVTMNVWQEGTSQDWWVNSGVIYRSSVQEQLKPPRATSAYRLSVGRKAATEKQRLSIWIWGNVVKCLRSVYKRELERDVRARNNVTLLLLLSRLQRDRGWYLGHTQIMI